MRMVGRRMTQRTVRYILSSAVVGMLAAGTVSVAAHQNHDDELGAAVAAIGAVEVDPTPPTLPEPVASEPAVTETSHPTTTIAPSDFALAPPATPADTQPAPASSVATSAATGVESTSKHVHVPAPVKHVHAPAPVSTTTTTTTTTTVPPVPSDDVAVDETDGTDDVTCESADVDSDSCESPDSGDDAADDDAEVISDPPPTNPNVSCGPVNSDGTGPVGCTSSDGGTVPTSTTPDPAPNEEHDPATVTE